MMKNIRSILHQVEKGKSNHSRWWFASGLCTVFKINLTKVLLYFLNVYFSSIVFTVLYIKTQKCSFLCNDNDCTYVGKICWHSIAL